MGYLLGIDIGTSGTKTLLCDEDGVVLATAMAEHPILSPQAGMVGAKSSRLVVGRVHRNQSCS